MTVKKASFFTVCENCNNKDTTIYAVNPFSWTETAEFYLCEQCCQELATLIQNTLNGEEGK